MKHIMLVSMLGSLALTTQPVSADTLFDLLESSGATITSGRMVSQGPTGATIEDFTFERFLNRFSAEKLVIDGDNHRFEGVRIDAMRRGDGTIYADQVVLDGEDSLWALYAMGGFIPSRDEDGVPIYTDTSFEEIDLDALTEPECGGLLSDGDAARNMRVWGLTIQGDLDSMPMGFSMGERFVADELQASFAFRREGEICHLKTDVDAIASKVFSISEDFLSIDRLSMAWYGSADIESGVGSVGRRFLLQGAELQSASGIRSLAFDDLLLELEQNAIWAGFSCVAVLGVEAFPVLDFTEAFSKGAYEASFELSGLDIDVDAFFPPDLIRDLGVGHLDFLKGDITSRSELVDGVSTSRAKISMPGIVEFSIGGRVSFPDVRSDALPAMISDNIPVPSEVLQLNIHNFDLTFEDQGVGLISEHLTGQKPEIMVNLGYAALRDGLQGSVPAFMMGKVDVLAQTVSDFVATGGEFHMKPERPQNVMTIAMQALMNPAGFADAMGSSFLPIE